MVRWAGIYDESLKEMSVWKIGSGLGLLPWVLKDRVLFVLVKRMIGNCQSVSHNLDDRRVK